MSSILKSGMDDKQLNANIIIVIWAIAIVAISVYGIRAGYLFYYHAALIIVTGLLFLSIAAIIMKRFEDSFIRFEELSYMLSRLIRNEDIRRDIEVLPFFVEERKKEYIKGLSKGYKDAENALKSAVNEIKSEIRTTSLEYQKLLDEMKMSLEKHREALEDATEHLMKLHSINLNKTARRRYQRKQNKTTSIGGHLRTVNQILSLLERDEIMKEKFKTVRYRMLKYRRSPTVRKGVKKL